MFTEKLFLVVVLSGCPVGGGVGPEGLPRGGDPELCQPLVNVTEKMANVQEWA